MKAKILSFSIYESSISIVFGLICLLMSLKFIEIFIIRTSLTEIVRKKNNAMAIFSGAVLYCFMSLTVLSILPSVNYLQTKLYNVPVLELSFYLYAFLVFLAGFAGTFFGTGIILFLCTQVFFISTQKIDEIEEIDKNKNTSIAIVLAFAMISLTSFIKPSLSNLMKSIVNYIS